MKLHSDEERKERFKGNIKLKRTFVIRFSFARFDGGPQNYHFGWKFDKVLIQPMPNWNNIFIVDTPLSWKGSESHTHTHTHTDTRLPTLTRIIFVHWSHPKLSKNFACNFFFLLLLLVPKKMFTIYCAAHFGRVRPPTDLLAWILCIFVRRAMQCKAISSIKFEFGDRKISQRDKKISSHFIKCGAVCTAVSMATNNIFFFVHFNRNLCSIHSQVE